MKKLTLSLTLFLAMSTASVGARAASIPTWIAVNTVVAYDFFSAALSGGVPVSGQSITGVQQATVTAVSAAAVSGTVQLTFNGIARSAQFSCSASGACTGYPANFWVDPSDPTHSFPNGAIFNVIPGTAPFTAAGRTWTAVTMTSANTGSGVQFQVIFDANSGLILDYSEHYPTQEVILVLRGLTGATLPTTPPAPTTPGPSPTATTSLVSSVLPSSRSVEVGATATAFATIINTGGNPGTGCGLGAGTILPVAFGFRTTNPATNAVTGTANALVDIPAGAHQTFVFSLEPSAAFAPTDIAITASCANSAAAPIISGVNTLLLSASTTPVPDVVALAATTQNDGILHITGTMGSNAFAVATVNVGAAASITATANTGEATLPISISLCQTNPTSGQCVSSIGPSVTTTINANATPTFGIFAIAGGAVPFVPQTNRIFVEFSDANEVVRGSTSVAVETQ